MTSQGRSLHRLRQPFDLLGRLGDYFAGRYLAKRARQHVADGLPSLAGFAFDYIAREVSLRGAFEREELAMLAQFLAPLADRFAATVALDIGANIGNHSLFFASHFKTVHSFEPNPRTFGVLSVNAGLVANVSVHNLALGDEPGTLSLTFNSLNVGEASLVQSYQGVSVSNVDVAVGVVDELAGQFGPVSFVKIDVEGFEPQVLRGTKILLREQHPIVAFEQNRAAFIDGRSEAAELLQEAGYRLCVMTKRNVGYGLIGQLRSAVAKMVNGIEYDIIEVERLTPGHYPMIIAVWPDDLTLLTRPV
jgi:FkbM family methyltransferase